ncbi:MAG TPA: sigma 54-interacting transcriptional regulator [Polyangiaceae bacterium]|jgi:transcriptional regulator with PAS, ATPase and Fis domain
MNSEQLTELDQDRAEVNDFSGSARAYLIVHGPDRADVVEVPIDRETVIGRGADAHAVIDDARVSRRHARLRWADGSLFIDDLGSRNGTNLNGEVLQNESRKARGGDCIRLAGREITVAIVSMNEPAAANDERPEPPSRPVSRPHHNAPQRDMPDSVVIAEPSMARMFGFTRRVAATSTTVLILGETGAGKEVVAQQIHAWSSRHDRPFVRVNCAALPETLVESELFGHERGAFTGAERRKIGFAEAAHEGTLFLDEIGELSLPVQAKLLAMLENRAIVRLGSTVETPVNVRVITATHRNLTEEVKKGTFREDLYYRIGVVVIRVPPLRERPSEVTLLAKLFAKRFGAQSGFGEATIAADAAAALVAHQWPGNIRELRNAIEHAVLLTEDGVIRREHLPETVLGGAVSAGSASASRSAGSRAGGVRAALAEVERASIEEALRAEGGNRTRAALKLGISLRSLLYKLEKYGIGR